MNTGMYSRAIIDRGFELWRDSGSGWIDDAMRGDSRFMPRMMGSHFLVVAGSISIYIHGYPIQQQKYNLLNLL
jgi:hypothetical protein